MADYVAEDAETSELLGQLWNLVEAWSSGAIRHARAAADAHEGGAGDAEIRILVEHAAELRMVLEDYLDRGDRPAVANTGTARSVGRSRTSARPDF